MRRNHSRECSKRKIYINDNVRYGDQYESDEMDIGNSYSNEQIIPEPILKNDLDSNYASKFNFSNTCENDGFDFKSHLVKLLLKLKANHGMSDKSIDFLFKRLQSFLIYFLVKFLRLLMNQIKMKFFIRYKI